MNALLCGPTALLMKDHTRAGGCEVRRGGVCWVRDHNRHPQRWSQQEHNTVHHLLAAASALAYHVAKGIYDFVREVRHTKLLHPTARPAGRKAGNLGRALLVLGSRTQMYTCFGTAQQTARRSSSQAPGTSTRWLILHVSPEAPPDTQQSPQDTTTASLPRSPAGNEAAIATEARTLVSRRIMEERALWGLEDSYTLLSNNSA